MEYAFTEYFEKRVLLKRPYLTKEMCIRVLESPLREELQEDKERVRYWGFSYLFHSLVMVFPPLAACRT